jgi:hypothetical protein
MGPARRSVVESNRSYRAVAVHCCHADEAPIVV